MAEIAGLNPAPAYQNDKPEPNTIDQDKTETVLIEDGVVKSPADFEILHEEKTEATEAKTESEEKPTTNPERNFVEKFFYEGPQWFQHFRNHFVTALNAVGIGLNTFAVIASSNKNVMPEPVAQYLDKTAEWYSRYVVSLGFGWNGIESLVGKRPMEAAARFLPALGFMVLPFYNFNLSTGISSFMSYVLDKVVRRNGDVQPGIGSSWENTKGIMKHTKDIFKDFFSTKSKESLIERLSIAGMGIGTFGGLLFASQQRDSWMARFFGNLRNVGGLVGDYELVFNNDKTWRGPHKKTVGLTCSTASILNIIARWVSPELGRILNHLSIAADDFGLTYWAQMSKKDNDEATGNKVKTPEETPKATATTDLHLAV